MTLGSLNHLSLTVSNVEHSAPFYNAILGFMGYQQVEKNDEFIMWWSKDAGAIFISAANPDSPNKVHDCYSPGLHHLAFNADSREQVDNLYKLILDIGSYSTRSASRIQPIRTRILRRLLCRSR